jgi:hypothetical protein
LISLVELNKITLALSLEPITLINTTTTNRMTLFNPKGFSGYLANLSGNLSPHEF